MAIVEINNHSGFCSGVVKAIDKAESFLDNNDKTLYCLGDIVHNNKEVERLEAKGMKTISAEEFEHLSNVDVMFRAHGEPPRTYKLAKERGIRYIDTTCPVVLNLQARIRKVYEENSNPDLQIVIFGKSGHAEVIGLMGQTQNTAIIVESLADVKKLNFSHPISLFSQTTKSLSEFKELVAYIYSHMNSGVSFVFKDSICRQVANRLPYLRRFAEEYDCVLFVAGAKSSNGHSLFKSCYEVNKNTFFISGVEDIKEEFVKGFEKIGICGATSTPLWLMEDVKKAVLDCFL